MIKIGETFKVKSLNQSSHYRIEYAIVTDTTFNMVEYRDIQNMEYKYTAQICDFLLLFDPWARDE